MSDNILKEKAGGIITVQDFNQYFIALTGKFVPRTGGIPTDLGSSLGDSTRRWDNAYVRDLFIGESASGLAIDDVSDDMVFKVGNIEKTRIAKTHLDLTVGSDPGRGGIALSSFVSPSTSSTSYADMTGLTVTLTTSGRPVEITLRDGSSTGAGIQVDGGNAVQEVRGNVKLVRDTTDIAEIEHEVDIPGGATWNNEETIPASVVRFIDTNVPAGTYTWKLQGKVNSGSNNLSLIGRLMAREIL